MRLFVAFLKVTNDTEDRAVSLVQQFCVSLTGDERDLQWMLRAIESHPRKHPDLTNCTLDRQQAIHVMVITMQPLSEHVALTICLTMTSVRPTKFLN